MENRINIAELLKDCPKGMELYSPIFGEVYLDKIRPHLAIVVTTDKEQGDFKEEFLYDGRYGMNGECMLFPSKVETSWEGFHRPFKDGDIVTWEDRGSLVACIYKERKNTASFNHYIALYKGGLGIVINGEIALTDDELSFATEEERQKLFKAIKDNGYKWNAETKTLEKLVVPNFKVGNKIIRKGRKGIDYPIEVLAIENGRYKLPAMSMPIDSQDEWELVSDKFDINTLKIFESRVLVRDDEDDSWRPAIFGGVKKENKFPYFIIGGIQFRHLIPYEGNEHLCLSENDCDEFYKTWE